MDKELREKIISIVCNTVCRFRMENEEQIVCGAVKCPLKFFLEKVSGEPPVLSEEQLEQVEKSYIDEDLAVNFIRLGRGHTDDLKQRVAQAQRDADVRYFNERVL